MTRWEVNRVPAVILLDVDALGLSFMIVVPCVETIIDTAIA